MGMDKIKKPLDGALYLAEKGYKVFPLVPGGKTPALKGDWKEWATSDVEKIRSVGVANPTFNWGVYTGGSGLTVVDVDAKGKRNGLKAWQELQMLNGYIPHTLKVKTPSGGEHYYFTGLGILTKDLLADGIETRSEGSYVVAPGSRLFTEDLDEIINHGTYDVEVDVRPAEVPHWVARPEGSGEKRMERPDDDEVPGSISEGGRDNELTKWAGVLRGAGLVEAEMLAALREMNELRCDPPLPDEDVERIASSIARKERGDAKFIAEFGEVADVSEQKEGEKKKPHSFWVSEVAPEDITPTQWVVKNRFARGFVTATLAPGGTGKSRVAMVEALGISLGRSDILGQTVRTKGATWYISTEDPFDDLQERSAGAIEKYKLHGTNVRMRVTSGQILKIKLVTKDSGKYVVNEGLVKEMIRYILEANIVLLVIDPFVKCHGIEENDNTGIDVVMTVLSRIAAEGNCAVHIIHHTRKVQDKNTKGFRGDMDVSRGASSLVSAARIAHTLTHYCEELDGRDYQIPNSEAWSWVRLDSAKGNLSAKSNRPVWWHLESVRLPCHKDPEDSVGVAVARLPDAFDAVVTQELHTHFLTLFALYMDSHGHEVRLLEFCRAVRKMPMFAPMFTLDGLFANDDTVQKIQATLEGLFTLPIAFQGYTYSTGISKNVEVITRRVDDSGEDLI